MEPTMPDMGTAACAYAPVVETATSPHALAGLPPRDLISKEVAAAILGVTTRTMNNMHDMGRGPARYRLGPRCLRYSEREVRAWLESCREEPKDPTADLAAA